jgi:hypothetical protein
MEYATLEYIYNNNNNNNKYQQVCFPIWQGSQDKLDNLERRATILVILHG